MEILFWTAGILGLLGAIAMALSGHGMEVGGVGDAADAGSALDAADAFHVADAAHVADMAHAADALHAADAWSRAEATVQAMDMHHLSEVIVHAAQAGEDVGQFKSHLRLLDDDGPDPNVVQLSPYSSFAIFSFLGVFGILGLGLLRVFPAWTEPMILGSAFGTGLVFAIVIVKVFNRILRGVSMSSTAGAAEYIGGLAEALITIAPGGFGELSFSAAGRRMSVPGKNVSGRPIPRKGKVRLGPKQGNFFLVEPLDPRELELLVKWSELEQKLEQVESLTPPRSETH